MEHLEHLGHLDHPDHSTILITLTNLNTKIVRWSERPLHWEKLGGIQFDPYIRSHNHTFIETFRSHLDLFDLDYTFLTPSSN